MLPFAFPKPLFEFEAERPQIEPLFALLPTYSNLVQSTLCTSWRCLVMLFLHFAFFFAAINGSTRYGRAACGGVELVRPLFE